MGHRDYRIVRRIEAGNAYQFFWSDSSSARRAGDVMPAILNKDIRGEVFRVEVVYLQSELEENGLDLSNAEMFSRGDLFIQVGADVPVSLILAFDRMNERPVSSVNGEAWVLVTDNGAACGVEVVVPS